MNKLASIRNQLDISPRVLVNSCGSDTSLMPLRRYNAIENGTRIPTLNDKKSILALININRSERSLPYLSIEDVFPVDDDYVEDEE